MNIFNTPLSGGGCKQNKPKILPPNSFSREATRRVASREKEFGGSEKAESLRSGRKISMEYINTSGHPKNLLPPSRGGGG